MDEVCVESTVLTEVVQSDAVGNKSGAEESEEATSTNEYVSLPPQMTSPKLLEPTMVSGDVVQAPVLADQVTEPEAASANLEAEPMRALLPSLPTAERTVILPPASDVVAHPDLEEEDYEDEEAVATITSASQSLEKNEADAVPTVVPSTPEIQKVALHAGKKNDKKSAGVIAMTSNRLSSERPKKGMKETKAVGYMVEGPERIEPSTTNKHEPSELVYVRFLVRPFTAAQLSQMITARYGTVSELWLDRIKSSAIVRMQTPEAAIECRKGLDGSRWPSINPRVLRCDFTNEALFTWMKEHGQSGDKPPPRHLVFSSHGDGKTTGSDLKADVTRDSRGCTARDTSPLGRSGRSGTINKRLSDRLQSDRKRNSDSSRNISDASTLDKRNTIADEKRGSKMEEPAKRLDELFKKTEAPPCIYWLPLSDSEASAQQEARVAKLKQGSHRRVRESHRPGQRDTRSPFASPASQPTAEMPRSHSFARKSDTNEPAGRERQRMQDGSNASGDQGISRHSKQSSTALRPPHQSTRPTLDSKSRDSQRVPMRSGSVKAHDKRSRSRSQPTTAKRRREGAQTVTEASARQRVQTPPSAATKKDAHHSPSSVSPPRQQRKR